MAGNLNNVLIPNVSRLPKHKKVDVSNRLPHDIKKSGNDEFKKLLNNQIDQTQANHGIKLSLHAAKRLNERNLQMDGDEYIKLKSAIDKLRAKGGKESLIITNKAAYIVDINNNKVVTAIDKDSISDNVFTKIDSTMILN